MQKSARKILGDGYSNGKIPEYKSKHCKRIQGKLARIMFKERLLETLKRSQNGNKTDEVTLQTMTKIQNHKKLSSEEFLKVYDAIRKEGPKTAYQNPDSWRKAGDTV